MSDTQRIKVIERYLEDQAKEHCFKAYVLHGSLVYIFGVILAHVSHGPGEWLTFILGIYWSVSMVWNIASYFLDDHTSELDDMHNKIREEEEGSRSIPGESMYARRTRDE